MAVQSKRCYHPRSCQSCDRVGTACGQHIVGRPGHESCKGSLPAHLLPTSCYVCGSREDHGPTFTETGKGHDFWSNADADKHFRDEDARLSRPGYVEARYVETTRGR